jgi:hypothetical protein
MRSRLPRLAVALSAIAFVQGCAALQNVRVAPLRAENSSANRSMVSQFNPLASQHRSVNDRGLLKAPEDRGRTGLWLYPR